MLSTGLLLKMTFDQVYKNPTEITTLYFIACLLLFLTVSAVFMHGMLISQFVYSVSMLLKVLFFIVMIITYWAAFFLLR